MKCAMKAVGDDKNNHCKLLARYLMVLVGCLVVLFFACGATWAQTNWPHVVQSKDGTPISYEIYGAGEPTLVFVHGWNCDGRYWRSQLPHFSKKHRLVIIDLAGHGHSGTSRSNYTMKAFGGDVQAVTEAVGSPRVILIGHSMGGTVIAEAARLMPNRVMGLIGVDTLQNIAFPMTREKYEEMVAPLKKDFRSGAKQFAGTMISADTDPALREWILSDMSAAPPAVALSAFDDLMSLYISGDAAKRFAGIRIPVVAVCADKWPINYEANRKHMASFDAIVIKGADHFLMMNRSEEFNKALDKAIDMIASKSGK